MARAPQLRQPEAGMRIVCLTGSAQEPNLVVVAGERLLFYAWEDGEWAEPEELWAAGAEKISRAFWWPNPDGGVKGDLIFVLRDGTVRQNAPGKRNNKGLPHTVHSLDIVQSGDTLWWAYAEDNDSGDELLVSSSQLNEELRPWKASGEIADVWLACPDPTTIVAYARKTNGTIRCRAVDALTGRWK
jgi:hypothetical protein